MEHNDFLQLSTCEWLWRYIGIEKHADLSLLRAYMLCKGRDIARWIGSWV